MPFATALPQYPDIPPAGYQLASNRQIITARDLVFYQGTTRRDAGWERPRAGQNIVGGRVHDLWPDILAIAVARSAPLAGAAR
jgi:hypothetical protein